MQNDRLDLTFNEFFTVWKTMLLRDAIKKKNYLDRDIVPISSDPPTYETDRDNLDRDNW